MKKIRVLVGALPLLLLSSCQGSFIVKVEEGGNPTRFAFYDDKILHHERIKPCLKYLQVHEMRETAAPVKIWEVRASGRECADVEAVSYGQAPAGFVQHGAPPPLRRGTTYRVEVEDGDLRAGAGQFRLP
ncbi:MAG TPA: hypothetical protein VGA98_01175 [Allosphingosinicella sp.]|jgi:hypothetical protein